MIIDKTILKYLIGGNAIIKEDRIWFSSGWCNFLFSADRKTYEIYFCKPIPEGSYLSAGTVVYMFENDHYIYIILNNRENNIVRFNEDNYEFEVVKKRVPKRYYSIASCKDDKYIFLTVWNHNEVIVLKKSDLSYIKLDLCACKGIGIQT